MSPKGRNPLKAGLPIDRGKSPKIEKIHHHITLNNHRHFRVCGSSRIKSYVELQMERRVAADVAWRGSLPRGLARRQAACRRECQAGVAD